MYVLSAQHAITINFQSKPSSSSEKNESPPHYWLIIVCLYSVFAECSLVAVGVLFRFRKQPSRRIFRFNKEAMKGKQARKETEKHNLETFSHGLHKVHEVHKASSIWVVE